MLNTIGTMSSLNREKVGEFQINQAIKIDEIKEKFDINNLISIEEFFQDKNEILLSPRSFIAFINGVKLMDDNKDDIYRIPAILEKENVREEVYLIIKNGVIYDVVNRTNEDVITPSMINYNLKDYNISIIIYQYVDGNLIEIVSPIDINNFYLTSTPLENELYYYIVFEIDNDLRFFGPDIISKE